MQIHPRTLIVLGFFLVLSGFVIPFLMVLRIIQPGLLLSFLSYGASISGLLLGLIGIAWYSRPRKH
jgi:multisubunit Na+/H+ antiporter MnhC subunit